MVENSNRDSEFSSEKLTDALQTESIYGDSESHRATQLILTSYYWYR